jgi:lipoprotein-anchoring transpeptidase ErfK/SrfK
MRARDLRVWRPAPPPAEADGPWVDIDLDQQTLALREGETTRFVTLISSGLPGTSTPTGTYSVTDMAAHSPMRSRQGAEDWYHVEEVPWVVHFKPRYALHGAFWHWGFGHRASHGCVNLAPRDAAIIFDYLAPTLPPGWHTVYATPTDLPTVVRIR